VKGTEARKEKNSLRAGVVFRCSKKKHDDKLALSWKKGKKTQSHNGANSQRNKKGGRECGMPKKYRSGSLKRAYRSAALYQTKDKSATLFRSEGAHKQCAT